MALSGSFTGTTSNTRIQPKITWSAKQSVSGNYSDVTATLTYSRTNTGYTTSGAWSGSITIGSETTTGSVANLVITYNSNTVAMSATTRVYHDSDGTKKVTISCTGSIPVASLSSTTCSSTITLDTIPRASQPSCIDWPNTIDDVGNMGNTITIHMNRKADFTHTVRYKWYSKTGTIATGVTNNCSWTIPTDFANDIPNATSSWGTIYADTYNGTTLIGTNSVKFTVHIPANSNPVFSIDNVSYADINTTITDITHDNQKIVQNKSNLSITYTAATAKNGSSISQYSFTLNGVTKTSTAAGGTINFGIINSSQNLTLTATVKDSRDLTTSVTKTVIMLPYSPPSALVSLTRLNNYEDTTTLIVDGTISSVDGLNVMTILYRYKQSGGEYNELVEIEDNVPQSLICDKNYAYIFEVQITDLFGGTFVREYVLGKGKFPLFIDIKNQAVGVNEFPSPGEALRVANGIGNFEDGIKVQGSPIADFIIEQGISGIWTYRKWYSGTAECWGTDTYTLTHMGTGLSGIYGYSGNISLPTSLFSEAPDSISACIPWYYSEIITMSATSKDTITYRLFELSANGQNITSFKIGCHVIGKWK